MTPHPKDSLNQDLMQPFQLETSGFRGRLVKLGPALDLILHQHAYPPAVGALLAESMVIASALGTALKYEGVFTFQAKGDGPVRLLVADVTSEGGLRAYAQTQEGYDFTTATPDTKLLGKGFLTFTVDNTRGSAFAEAPARQPSPSEPLAEPKLREERRLDRYQGIVTLEGGSLAEAVQHYFRQSEQLPTGLVAAVRQDQHGRWRGGCLMLQQMPREGGAAHVSDTSLEDDWYRAMMLMGTCSVDELVDPALMPNELLYRLFHEEGVRVYNPHAFRHECRCSEARVVNMLRALPREEIESLAIGGLVTVTCEFCNKGYRFNKKQRDVLYAGERV